MATIKTERIKTWRGDLVFVLLILVSIAAMVNVIVLQSQYSSGASDQAIATAEAYSLDVSEKFAGQIEYVRERTTAVANMAQTTYTESDFNTLLNRTFIIDDVVAVRYFKNDNE